MQLNKKEEAEKYFKRALESDIYLYSLDI